MASFVNQDFEGIRIEEESKTGFSWRYISTRESDKFLKYLRLEHQIDCGSKPDIIENDGKIMLGNPDKKIWLELDERKSEAFLKIGDNKFIEFVAITDNDDWKLYEKNLYNDLRDMQMSLYREVHREEPCGLTIDLEKAGRGVLNLNLSLLPYIGKEASKLIKNISNDTKGAINTLSDAVERKKIITNIERIQFVEQFHDKFEKIIKEHYIKKNRRAVVFIDDLDRCVPEKAIEVMEAIKLFLDAEGCIFILGIDKKVISSGVRLKYGDLRDEKGKVLISGEEYLEKIIQFTFILPPILDDNLEKFINHYDSKRTYENYYKMIISGIGQNPRKIKRFINTIEFQRNLANQIPDVKKHITSSELEEIFTAFLIEWQILSNSSNIEYSDFRKHVSRKNELLLKMHEYLESGQQEQDPPELKDFLNGSIKELIGAFPCKDKLKSVGNEEVINLIDKVIHLSSVTETKRIIETEEDGPLTREKVEEIINKGMSLEGKNLSKIDLRGLPLKRVNLNGANLTDANLSKTDLSEARLVGANLTYADLSGATLLKTDLTKAKLHFTILNKANLSEAILNNAILSAANLNNATLNKADLTTAYLSGSDFSYAKLSGAKLPGGLGGNDFTGVDFSEVDLSNTELGTRLSGAILSGRELPHKSFEGADLSNAKLRKANLFNAKLMRANLSNADFSNATLNHADFSDANLEHTNFFKAKLINAYFYDSNLSNVKLLGTNISDARLIETITTGVEVNKETRAEGVILVRDEDNQDEAKIKRALDNIDKELREIILRDTDRYRNIYNGSKHTSAPPD